MGGSLGGVLFATAVFYAITRVAPKPLPVIYVAAAVVLLASLILPIRLFRTSPPPHPRFRGITIPIAATMIVMHTLTATASLLTVRFWYAPGARGGSSR